KTMSTLVDYHWPGNVRELENFIERAVILSRGANLEIPVAELKQRAKVAGFSSPNGLGTLEHAEREHISRTLSETNWVIGGTAGAASRLSIKRKKHQTPLRKHAHPRPRKT